MKIYFIIGFIYSLIVTGYSVINGEDEKKLFSELKMYKMNKKTLSGLIDLIYMFLTAMMFYPLITIMSILNSNESE